MKRIKLCMLVLCVWVNCMSSYAIDDNYLVVPNQYAAISRQMVLSVEMKNVVGIYGYQFDIILPVGISIAVDKNNDLVVDGGTRGPNHTVFGNRISSNVYRIATANFNGVSFSETNGSVCRITLVIDPKVTPKLYDLKLYNIELAAKGNKVIKPSAATCKLTVSPIGDANADFMVNVADVVTIITKTQMKNPSPFNPAAADVDPNGSVNSNDAASLVQLILEKE